MNQKLQAKDFITVGVFTAILFVVCFGVAMIGFIPYLIPLIAVFVPLIGGIPFMLFTTKAQKFGMTTIMGILVGLVNGMMGHGIWAFFIGPACGLIADFIMKSGSYKSVKKNVIACSIFFIWTIGNFLPIIFTREQYHEMLSAGGYGTEYADALMKVVPDWSLIPLTIVAIIFGLLGGLLGKAMLKKHFKRAGIV